MFVKKLEIRKVNQRIGWHYSLLILWRLEWTQRTSNLEKNWKANKPRTILFDSANEKNWVKWDAWSRGGTGQERWRINPSSLPGRPLQILSSITVVFEKTHWLHLLDSCILMRIIPAVMCGRTKIILLEINSPINKRLKFHGHESKYHDLDYQEEHK